MVWPCDMNPSDTASALTMASSQPLAAVAPPSAASGHNKHLEGPSSGVPPPSAVGIGEPSKMSLPPPADKKTSPVKNVDSKSAPKANNKGKPRFKPYF